jgi:vitamin B12 transporter
VGYEGNTEADGARNLTVSGKLGYELSGDIGFHLSFRTIRSRLEIDNFGGNFGDDPNNMERTNALVVGGGARALFARNRWESRLNVSYLEYDRSYDNPVDDLHPSDSDESTYKSGLFKLDWQNNIFAHETNTLTAGLEYAREQGESEYFSESEWGPYESFFPRETAGALGIYFQDRVSLGGRFFAAVGGRYDRHSRAGGAITFRIAPGVFFPETGTRLKATLGTGFKSPSLYQLFAPATPFGPVGNEGLEPEKSTAWDLGIEQDFLGDRLVLGALYFSNAFENLIDYDFVEGYINIGRASTEGGEFFLRARPSASLDFRAGYTLTKARDETSGESLLRRPRHKFSAAISSSITRKGRLSAELVYLGTREDLFWTGIEPERVVLAACTLVNAAASFDVMRHLQVFARLDNILDARYELVKGYGTPGFSLYGGLRLDY